MYLCAKLELVSAASSSNSAECTGDIVRNLEVNSFLSSQKDNYVVHVVAIDIRSSIYYVVYSKLVKINSETQFFKLHTVLYR